MFQRSDKREGSAARNVRCFCELSKTVCASPRLDQTISLKHVAREPPLFIGKSPLRHTVEVGIRDGVGALRSKGDKRGCPHRIWKHSDLLPR